MPDPSTVPVSADMLVANVMRRWPPTAAVFLRRRMACPGCPMAPFMTVVEAAKSYGIDADDLVADLSAAVPFTEAGGQP